MQRVTVQTRTRVGKQWRQFQRQQYLLPAAPTGFSLPSHLFLHEQCVVKGEGAGLVVTCAPRAQSGGCNWQWDAAEHGGTGRLIHLPLNHEAASLLETQVDAGHGGRTWWLVVWCCHSIPSFLGTQGHMETRAPAAGQTQECSWGPALLRR